jgi:glycosyltransferase involved in cell wall biosynthesis
VKDKFQPLVSIIIPVFNGSNFMREAIDSALAQTYKNVEIIVVNDGSNDEGKTEKIALSYGDKIRYFFKENGWVSSALNMGIKQMKGDYFSWLSHDDQYYPQKIEAQILYLKDLQDKSTILYTDFSYMDEKSIFLSDYKVKHVPPEHFRPAFIWGGLINGCTLLIPKKCFNTFGLFNESLRTTQDYELWFRFSERYSFVHMPQIMVKSRLHSNQVAVRIRPIMKQEENKLYTHFITKIKPVEIISYYEKPIPLFYLDYSIFMKNLNLNKTSSVAFLMGSINIWRLKKEFVSEYLVKTIQYLKASFKHSVSLIRKMVKI